MTTRYVNSISASDLTPAAVAELNSLLDWAYTAAGSLDTNHLWGMLTRLVPALYRHHPAPFACPQIGTQARLTAHFPTDDLANSHLEDAGVLITLYVGDPGLTFSHKADDARAFLLGGGWDGESDLTLQHVLDALASVVSAEVARSISALGQITSLAELLIGGPGAIREEAHYIDEVTDESFRRVVALPDHKIDEAIRKVADSAQGDRFSDILIETMGTELEDLRAAVIRELLSPES